MNAITKNLPATGGIGWAENPWEQDDIGIDRQIDHETEVAVTSYEHYQDLVEHCAGNVGFTNALHSIVSAYRELQIRPMDIGENRHLQDEVYHGVESLVDAFEDVARLRVGEYVEKGESYVYEVEG